MAPLLHGDYKKEFISTLFSKGKCSPQCCCSIAVKQHLVKQGAVSQNCLARFRNTKLCVWICYLTISTKHTGDISALHLSFLTYGLFSSFFLQVRWTSAVKFSISYLDTTIIMQYSFKLVPGALNIYLNSPALNICKKTEKNKPKTVKTSKKYCKNHP